jgi:hypothetical protein
MAVATMVMTGDVDGSWRWPSLSYSQAPENINYNRDHNHAVRFLMLRALRMLRAGLLWRCGRRLQQVPCVCLIWHHNVSLLTHPPSGSRR